jgi:ABC-type microcin C transport system permease subunit YejB
MDDRFGIAIVVAAVTTAAIAILLVWLFTDGEWYVQAIVGLAVWATCWGAMGITSRFADYE